MIASNVRLGNYPLHLVGQLPPGVSPESLSSYRRYVDAAVILPDKVILVEAKIVLQQGARDALQAYAKLWPSTPEYKLYSKLPVKLLIVAAVIDPIFKQMAEADGIQVVQYSPPWLSSGDIKSSVNTAPLSFPASTASGN